MNSRHCRNVMLCGLVLVACHSLAAADFSLSLRSRQPIAKGAPQFHVIQQSQTWKPQETAVVVCDMWDLHHCLNAVRRAEEMAPRMNQVLKAARDQGALIIHAPSSCMKFYQDHPARQRAQAAPPAKNVPQDIGQWCYKIPSEEQGEYPIDQSDGGEDDDPEEHARWAAELKAKGLNPRAPWTRQIKLLEIDPKRDAISDNGVEIWNLMEQRGIKNVILVGVHTNMCVLGRPFGLRQMAKNGKNVVLMRDMTDTMYNPKARPYVSHFTGTDLIVEHIEKWVCPTITSDQVIGGEAFRFSKDQRPHVVMLIGEREYRTNETLPKFAISTLGKEFRVSIVHADAKDRNQMPGIAVAGEADVLLVSVRRRILPVSQLKWVRDHVQTGKPVIGIRTANHAFTVRGDGPAGGDNWASWDAEVMGGSYSGHHGNGPVVKITVSEGARDHPILSGVNVGELNGYGSLYKVSPLRQRAASLLTGKIPNQPAEPIAWTHLTAHKGRVFYTSLGHIKDFEQDAFHQLLRNAVHWSLTPAASQTE